MRWYRYFQLGIGIGILIPIYQSVPVSACGGVLLVGLRILHCFARWGVWVNASTPLGRLISACSPTTIFVQYFLSTLAPSPLK